MAEQSPKAGRYRIVVTSWDRIKNGARTRFRLGDEVDLTDDEARRLAGSKHFPAAVKVQEEEGPKSSSTSTSTSSKGSESEKK